MGSRAINYRFQSADSVNISNYDSSKTNVGDLIKFYTGPNPDDKYVGPVRIGLARPMEQAVAIASGFPVIIKFNDTIDWIFLADIGGATTTRRIILYEFNKNTSEFTWKGFITINFPSGATGNKTIRSLDVTKDDYTTGTASVTGTTVTGTGTTWVSDALSAGSRIGFGSTDPSQITTWYQIISIDSETGITIDQSISVSNGAYVIEDLRVNMAITNSTAANGGLFVVKGLRYEDFSPAGTAILGATTIDNIKACYWLADAVTVTNTLAYGCITDTKTSWNSQDCYLLNASAAATARFYKYNVRSPLTLTAGKATDSFILSTNTLVTTGNISANNNLIIATAQHGPGNGIKSLYWVTASRVYRTDPAQITSGSTSFLSDAMVETPPGGSSTYPVTSTLSNVIYSTSIDKFIVFNTGASGNRSYVTEYNTTSNPFNHIFLTDTKQLDQSLADSSGVPHPTINGSTFSGGTKDGMLYMVRQSTAATFNQMYSLPIGAHQTYAFQTGNLVITPKFDLSSANKLYEVTINNIRRLGSDTFAMPTEPFRVFYRTSGIDDNTGIWSQLNDANNLEGIAPGEIQFAFTFRILGNTCIPARILSISVIYEDLGTDSHYIPSVSNSSTTNRIFAYRQTSLFVGNIPEMRIRIYNADTNGLILDDNTTGQTLGTFEYSTDGNTWNAWDNSQNTVGNYIRYTAASLPGGIKVRVFLSQ